MKHLKYLIILCLICSQSHYGQINDFYASLGSTSVSTGDGMYNMIGVDYLISSKFSIDLEVSFRAGNNIPDGFQFGNHNPLQYLDDVVKPHFIGRTTNLGYNRFSGTYINAYGTYKLHVKPLTFKLGLGIGLGNSQTSNFNLTNWSTQTDPLTGIQRISDVESFQIDYWFKTVFTTGAKFRAIYPVTEQASFFANVGFVFQTYSSEVFDNGFESYLDFGIGVLWKINSKNNNQNKQ